VNVSIAEAKGHLPQLIRAAEQGETVVITRHGKPVAQITCLPQPSEEVVLGGMADRVKLYPGWDAPIDLDRFLEGSL
jgi:prevent-host-death family protein